MYLIFGQCSSNYEFFCWTKAHFWSHWLLLFWTSCVLPHGFQIQSGSLTCTLSCLRAVILKVTYGATPAFSANRGVHCISVYMAWQPSHFDPHTCSYQTYPQGNGGTEVWARARTHDQGGSARRIADKLENTKIIISLKVLLQLFLKYAYTLDVSIHHFDHKAFVDGTLPIFQNF